MEEVLQDCKGLKLFWDTFTFFQKVPEHNDHQERKTGSRNDISPTNCTLIDYTACNTKRIKPEEYDKMPYAFLYIHNWQFIRNKDKKKYICVKFCIQEWYENKNNCDKCDYCHWCFPDIVLLVIPSYLVGSPDIYTCYLRSLNMEQQYCNKEVGERKR